MNFEIGDYQKQLRIAKKALEPEKQLTLPEAIDPFITEVIKHFRASADKNLLTPILGKLAQNCSTDMYVREEDGEVFIYIDYINTQDMVYIGHPKNFQKAVDANRVLQGYAEGQTKYTQKFDRGTTFGFYEIERIWELSISLHAKYGKVLPELQRAMQYWLAEKNEGSNDEGSEKPK